MTEMEQYQHALHHNAMVSCLLEGLIMASGLKHEYHSDGDEGWAWDTIRCGEEVNSTLYFRRPCGGVFDLTGNGELCVKIFDLELKLGLDDTKWVVDSSPFRDKKPEEWPRAMNKREYTYWGVAFGDPQMRHKVADPFPSGKRVCTQQLIELLTAALKFIRDNPLPVESEG